MAIGMEPMVTGTIFTCDKATGGNEQVHLTHYPAPAPGGVPFDWQFNNHSAICMYNSNSIIVSSSPEWGKYYFDNPYAGPKLFNAFLSDVNMVSTPTPFVGSTVEYQIGNESIQSMEFSWGYPALNGYIIAVGTANHSTQNDVYFAQLDPGMPAPPENSCVKNAGTYLETPVITTTTTSALLRNVYSYSPLSIVPDNVSLNVHLSCGEAFSKPADVADIPDFGTNMKLAPNPARNNVNMHYAIPLSFEKAEIKITDMSGRLLLSLPINEASGIVQIDLPSSTPAGTYTCSMYVDGQLNSAQKLIVQ